MRNFDESGVTGNVGMTCSNLVELLGARANEDALGKGYVFLADGEIENGRLTFADLDRRARAIAARLQTLGMVGERAVLLYPPGLEYIEAFFGCLYAGAIAVPAYPPTRQHLPRLQAVMRDAAPEIIMTTAELAAKFRDEFVGGALRAASNWFATDTVASDEAGCWQAPVLAPENIAFLQYTSGSTGDPKGVMVSHGNLLANQKAIRQSFGHTERSTVVGWLPLYHDMGLIGNILQPLYVGSTAVLMSPMAFLEKPVRWLKAISEYRAATSGGPNFAYDLCVRKVTAEQKRDLDLSAWTLAFNGSEPVRHATLERFAGAFAECGFRRESFFPCYGLAEATLFVTGARLETGGLRLEETKAKPRIGDSSSLKSPASSLVSCGLPADRHIVQIVDPHTGKPCLPGREGEIWVSGPSVAQGYWNRPEESENTFRARLKAIGPRLQAMEIRPLAASLKPEVSFLRTGDLGLIDDSRLYVTGRIKDLIIVRGRNVYPQDIEHALTDGVETLRPGGCAAFSVIGQDDEQLIVVAELAREAMRQADHEGVFASMRSALAEACELTAAELVLVQPGGVPKTSSGKLRRQACKQAYLKGTLPVVARSGEVTGASIDSGALPPSLAEQNPSPSGESEARGAKPIGVREFHESMGRAAQPRLLREALSVLPQSQRAALIARFFRTEIARLLRIAESDVPIDAPLRAAGLDSLKAVELKHALDDLLDIEAPLSLLLSETPLGEVAEALASQAGGLKSEAKTGVLKPPASDPQPSASSLSAPQIAMWAMQQMEPDSIVYNLHLALRLDGWVDEDLLWRAFDRLVQRHDMLRTVYRAEGDAVLQTVLPLSGLPDYFAVVDASALSETEIQNDMARRAREPFDLVRGPVFRAVLYRHSAKPSACAYTLLLCAHHIALDLWSLLILLNELQAIHGAMAVGREPELPNLSAGYRDFVAWQASYLASPNGERAWEFWRARLSGELPRLALPADRSGPKTPDYRGTSLALRFDREETRQLKALAGRHGVTLFALLLAAYKVLLHRCTRQTDLIVGVPTSGRSRSRFAPVVGNFVNPVPLRTYPAAGKPFLAYLAEVRDAWLGALEHQDFPFPLLVERLQPERTAEHWPIYQTLFVLQRSQAGIEDALAQLALGEDSEPWNWGDWRARSLALQQRVENFDLKLMAAECRDGLMFSFQYRRERFEPDTIARLAHRFEVLLRGIAADPDTCLGDLPLLPEAERRQVLAEWNATAADYPEEHCLHELFEAQAADTPDAVAVVYAGQRLSYGELNARANRLARHLSGLGVGPETRVGLYVERSAEAIVGILGILKAGGVYVPLNLGQPGERLAEILTDCDASVLLTQERWLEKLPEGIAQVLCLDHDWPDAAEPAAEPSPALVRPLNAAYLIYTSGSTGKPKGVAVSHANAVASTLARFRFYPEPLDGFLLLSAFAFDSSVAGIFWTLSRGGRLCIPPEGSHQDVEALADLVARERLTHLLCLPSLYGLLLDCTDRGRLDVLRVAIVAGEACPPDLAAKHYQSLPGTRLYNEYGPTEGTVWCSGYELPAATAEPDRSVSIGRPIANTRIYLLDARLNPVPVGVPGELCIGGAGVARGYHERPDLTVERFVPAPFGAGPGARLYRTGDLACWRPDGTLEFLGRIDHQVKIRGFRIEPGEVEARLRQHPKVREAVVVAREDVPGHKRLAAYLVSNAPTAEEPGESEILRAFLKEALPDYMIPTAFVRLDRLPLTPNGKLDRKALPVPETGPRLADQYVAPRNAAEDTLARLWADLLQVERVGIHDNFFALGGDSILAIQVVGRARQAGLSFTPRQLFQHQTVAELAGAAGQATDLHAEQGTVSGEMPLTPIQRWFFEQNLPNPHHWNQAVLLAIETPLDPLLVEQALNRLITHHDALRLRFQWEQGKWRQSSLAEESHSVFHRVDLSRVPGAQQAAEIEAECRRWQASLHLSEGPLLRAVWFDLGRERGARLLLVIHHLAVDGVSWRILLEDLHTACRQLAQGQAVSLPPKTTAFRHWAERLHRLAQSEVLREEMAYWLDAVADFPPLPVDCPDGARNERCTAVVITTLGAKETQSLLRKAPMAYRTGTNTLLLAALAQALGGWSRNEAVLIDVEGHGREDLFEDLDLSRTVGWFTSVFPVGVRLPTGNTPGGAVKAVKEQLRRTPRQGIGYGLLRYLAAGGFAQPLAERPAAQVLFNYLGQLDPALNGAPWILARESAGPCRNGEGTRTYELEITAHVADGQLHLEWRYSAGRYREATVTELAGRHLEALRALIAHSLSPEAVGLTPGDFPLARLTQAELDVLPYDPRVIEDIYPLSPMQEGMLFDTLMAPHSGIYFMQDRFELDGPVDEQLFRQAWQRVVDRHPALRTTFVWDIASGPCQIVHRRVDLPFEYLDWRDLPDSEQKARLDGLLDVERQRGFDFLTPPLVRIRLIRLGEDRYRFVRSYHHILVDAWCTSLILTDLKAHYEALVEDRTLSQPAAPSFRGYIAWLKNRTEESAADFWQQHLRGFAEPTPLRVDQPAPPGRESEQSVGDVIAFLSEQDTQSLLALAQRHHLTPNTFIQAAWSLMLGHYSGRSEVVFGVTVAGRPTDLAGSEIMLGLFINSLPLRVVLLPDLPLPDFLHGLLRQNIELRQYEYTPLVRIQSWSEVPRERPLFESLLVFENYPIDPSLRCGAGRLNIVGVETRTHTNYPLNGMVIPGERMHLQITYHTERFEAAVVERMLGHFKTLLEDMIRYPQKRLGELAMLTAVEHRQLVDAWNRTDRPYPEPCDVVARFEAQVERTPEAVAVACQGECLTYRELNMRANRLAHGLIRHGVRPDVIVVLLSDRGLDFLVMILGLFKAGGAYLPLDPGHPDGRLAQVLQESRAGLMLAGASYRERARALAATSLGFLSSVQPTILMLNELESREDRVYNPPRRYAPHNLAFVIFTSGSAGAPKGAMVEHRGMFNNLITKVPTLELTVADVIAQTAGQCFDISVWQHLTALVCGARVEIVPDETVREPGRLLKRLAESGITVLEAVPSLIQALVDMATDIELPSLRWLIACGEAFPPELCRRWMERFPHVRVLNAYGPAECSDDVSYYEVREPPAETDTLVPVGRPVDNTRLYLLDSWLAPVPVGVPGEICVAGIQVGRGYLHRPELTAEKFIPDPIGSSGGRLYRTGDLGRYREDGTIEFLGRIDHQVKIRGVRIEPGEIEAQLLLHPVVEQAVVMARDDGGPGGKRLVAYVVCGRNEEDNDAALADELRAHLSSRLPNYMVPSAFVRLDALPLSANGKIDRKALPVPNITTQREDRYMAPRSPTEEILAGIWKEVLGMERVGVEDNFFDLGGHSLIAVQVLSRVRAAFGVDVPLRRVFEASTIAQLALVIEECLIEQLESLSEEEAQALLEDGL